MNHIDTVEVVGSNPIVPTMNTKGLQRLKVVSPFLMVFCGQPSLVVIKIYNVNGRVFLLYMP